MKVALVGVVGVPLGKHKVKDPRLDQADKLVKADKKTYAMVDVVGEEEALTADAIVASPEGRFDLIVKDLEFAETRLARNPPAAETAVLDKDQGLPGGRRGRRRSRIDAGRIAVGRVARVCHGETDGGGRGGRRLLRSTIFWSAW